MFMEAKGKRVLVIGAGMAGLTAARNLAEAGRQVLVLCESLHDDICLARAYRVEGNYFAITGHYQQALRTYHQGLPIAREWQNWIEIDRLLEGIDFAVAGPSPLHPAVDLRDRDAGVPARAGVACAARSSIAPPRMPTLSFR